MSLLPPKPAQTCLTNGLLAPDITIQVPLYLFPLYSQQQPLPFAIHPFPSPTLPVTSTISLSAWYWCSLPAFQLCLTLHVASIVKEYLFSPLPCISSNPLYHLPRFSSIPLYPLSRFSSNPLYLLSYFLIVLIFNHTRFMIYSKSHLPYFPTSLISCLPQNTIYLCLTSTQYHLTLKTSRYPMYIHYVPSHGPSSLVTS